MKVKYLNFALKKTMYTVAEKFQSLLDKIKNLPM